MTTAGGEGVEAPAEPSRPTRMTEKERRAGLVVAILSLVLIAGSWLPKAIGGNAKGAELCIISTVLSLALFLAVRRASRVMGTFAAVLAGFPPSHFVAAALPVQLGCLGYGGWLMFATNRATKRANQADGLTPAQRAQARRAAKAARRRAPAAPPATGRRPATQSKRYTPPQKKRK